MQGACDEVNIYLKKGNKLYKIYSNILMEIDSINLLWAFIIIIFLMRLIFFFFFFGERECDKGLGQFRKGTSILGVIIKYSQNTINVYFFLLHNCESH